MPFEEINIDQFNRVVIVSSQPDHNENMALQEPAVILDHHPDSRALDVLEDGDGPPLFLAGFVHPSRPAGMRLGVTVGEVEPGDIHPGGNQSTDRLAVTGGRADRGEDLRLAIHGATLEHSDVAAAP